MRAREVAKSVLHRLGWDFRRWPLPETVEGHLRTAFQRLGINCVIDVGANTGQYALRLRGSGFQGRIVSVEPVPDAFVRLAERAGADPEWHVRQHALGAADGVDEIRVARSSSVSSFLAPKAWYEEQYPLCATRKLVSVAVRRLSVELLGEVTADISEPRVMLKLDTQGLDYAILQGAGEALSRIDAVQTELSVLPIYEEMTPYHVVIEGLRQRGFALTGVFPVSARSDGALIEADGVFVRTGE